MSMSCPSCDVENLQDDPTRLAEILVAFWRRNDFVVVGVKRVGES